MEKIYAVFLVALLATTAMASTLSAVNGTGLIKAVNPVLKREFVSAGLWPKVQYVKETGGMAEYTLAIQDRHPTLLCKMNLLGIQENGTENSAARPTCFQQPITYEISVRGLPFEVKVPETVTLMPGETKKVDITVYTGNKVSVEAVETENNTLQKARIYHFDASVKSKSGDAQDTAKGVLVVGGDNVSPPPIPVPGENVVLKLDQGWSIVSLPGAGRGMPVKTLQENLMTVAVDNGNSTTEEVEKLDAQNPQMRFFIYLKDEKKFASFKEAREIMGPAEFRKYLLQNAFWAYTPEARDLVFHVRKFSSYGGLALKDGWNFIPVTRDMPGKKLSEIGGSCDFQASYLYNSGAQKWEKLGMDDAVSKDYLFSGIVARINGDCKLAEEKMFNGGTPAESVSVPELPE